MDERWNCVTWTGLSFLSLWVVLPVAGAIIRKFFVERGLGSLPVGSSHALCSEGAFQVDEGDNTSLIKMLVFE